MPDDSDRRSVNRRQVLRSGALVGGGLLVGGASAPGIVAADGQTQTDEFEAYMSISSYRKLVGIDPVDCAPDSDGWGQNRTFTLQREALDDDGEPGVYLDSPACDGDQSDGRFRGYLITAGPDTECQGGPSGEGPWVEPCCSWLFVDADHDVPTGARYRISSTDLCDEDAQARDSDEDPLGAPFDLARVSIDPEKYTQVAKLAAADGDEQDLFGWSVAVSGTTAVVGARDDEDPHGEDGGSAYVFTQVGGQWGQQQKLVATDGDADDNFGDTVAVDEDTAVVGAVDDEDPNGRYSGSAYVFERSKGRWNQQTKLVAEDGEPGDSFGDSVAIDGDTIVVAAASAGPGIGALYVFTQSDESWVEQAKLTADDGDGTDLLGTGLAMDGDTVVAGARLDEDPNGRSAGSAYVFERSDGAWRQRAKLAAEDGDEGDNFGTAVDIDGDTIVVGADRDEDLNGRRAGSAYIFVRSDGGWTQQAKLAADDGSPNANFGSSVATERGFVFIGAPANPTSAQTGATYVFTRTDGTWNQTVRLTADDGDDGDRFGFSVAASRRTLLAGAPGDGDPNGWSAGSAYVFER